jgi:excinuclease UvrABC helicase subunit UvrB
MLLEPQVNHSNNLLESIKSNGFAKDLSETGTGKTYSACHIARELDMPTVVICPVSVIPTWKKILSDNNVKNPILINYEKLVSG